MARAAGVGAFGEGRSRAERAPWPCSSNVTNSIPKMFSPRTALSRKSFTPTSTTSSVSATGLSARVGHNSGLTDRRRHPHLKPQPQAGEPPPLTNQRFGYLHCYQLYIRHTDEVVAAASGHTQYVPVMLSERDLVLLFCDMFDGEHRHADVRILECSLSQCGS